MDPPKSVAKLDFVVDADQRRNKYSNIHAGEHFEWFSLTELDVGRAAEKIL